MDNERKSLPMVALRGMTIMPEMVVHFDVSRERSIAAIQEAMVEEQKIFLAAQKSIETEDPGQEDVYDEHGHDHEDDVNYLQTNITGLLPPVPIVRARLALCV